MKTKILSLLVIAFALGCSKDEPAPAAATVGCSVLFKGTTHTFTIAVCVDAGLGSTIDGLSATETTATKAFVIARDTADPTANSLSLNLDLTGANLYIAADGITSQPTITRSGKSWTFSGTASNGTDSGAISGTCTCSN
jgi:hypothetical protein